MRHEFGVEDSRTRTEDTHRPMTLMAEGGAEIRLWAACLMTALAIATAVTDGSPGAVAPLFLLLGTVLVLVLSQTSGSGATWATVDSQEIRGPLQVPILRAHSAGAHRGRRGPPAYGSRPSSAHIHEGSYAGWPFFSALS